MILGSTCSSIISGAISMVRSVLLFLIIALSSIFTLGQDSSVWRGLVFDESSAETTVTAIGKPKKRKTENLSTFSSLSTKASGEIKVQTIVYEKTDGWEKVALSFFDDKLFRAKFWPRNKTM